MKRNRPTLAELVAHLGEMNVDQFPTARAARAAAELVDEFRKQTENGEPREPPPNAETQ